MFTLTTKKGSRHECPVEGIDEPGAESTHFDSLTRNAFDFLKRGIEEFDKAPKYSVIHFCAAVEMLLKARLMREHWSLIVSKQDQANLTKFMAGDFMSVTLEEARARIRDVAGEDIGDDAFNSFRTLANHRNKMVHFFHGGLDSDDKAKEQIVAEQCRAWFHLHRLLIRWDGYFSDFHDQIAQADRAMKRHRKYLTAKFKALRSDLEAKRKSGHPPQPCNACGFKAAIAEGLDDQIASLHCSVCDHVETQVQLHCPHCGESITVTNEGYATCDHCEGQIEPSHLLDALTDQAEAYRAMQDGRADELHANCGNCDGHHTVVCRGDRYFCASCFDITHRLEQCGFCGQCSTGNMEDSYAYGCGQCEGQWGNMKDKYK